MLVTEANWEQRSASVARTRAIGQRLGAAARPGDILLLIGELGAGKTALTQGLARGLDIGEVVNSPTFTLLKEHRSGRVPLYHFDLYRIERASELIDLGFGEYFGGDGVAVVEWADRVANEIFGSDWLQATITTPNNHGRIIHWRAQGQRAEEWLTATREPL